MPTMRNRPVNSRPGRGRALFASLFVTSVLCLSCDGKQTQTPSPSTVPTRCGDERVVRSSTPPDRLELTGRTDGHCQSDVFSLDAGQYGVRWIVIGVRGIQQLVAITGFNKDHQSVPIAVNIALKSGQTDQDPRPALFPSLGGSGYYFVVSCTRCTWTIIYLLGEIPPTPAASKATAGTTSDQGVSWETIGSNLASGAGGGLLVFILTIMVGQRRDRRDSRAAAQAVADELRMAITALDTGRAVAHLLPADAPAFETEAFREYRLMLYPRLRKNMSVVVDAYHQLSGVSVGALGVADDASRENIASDVTKAIDHLDRFARGPHRQ